MNSVPARKKAKGVSLRIDKLLVEVNHLLAVDGISSGVINTRVDEINRLKSKYEETLKIAALEDIKVYQTTQKVVRSGVNREYKQWQAAWCVGGRSKVVYLGRVSKLSEKDALRLARGLKAASLGINEYLPSTRPEKQHPTTNSNRNIKGKIVISNMVVPKKQEVGRGIIGDTE